MDISYDNESLKRCIKCDPTVLNNLYIVYNTSKTTFILWNKFQIFVYENRDLESAAKILFPEFQIHNLIVSGNYIICLDYSGNIHTTSLKFKNPTQKNIKFSFLPREHGVVASCLFDEDHTLCLKYEINTYFLCLHKINMELTMAKIVILCNEHIPTQTNNKCIMRVHSISESHLERLKSVFDMPEVNIRNKYYLVVITLDSHKVYGCLFSSKAPDEQATLKLLYSSPTDICDIHVAECKELDTIIGLTIGTIVKLTFTDLQTPEIIHLNTAIHKFLVVNNTLLYTDGKSMWKADDFLSKNIKFRQFFISQVKDFIKVGEQIVCTTFMNLIYTFPMDNEGSYVKHQFNDEYCSAEKVLNNSEYIQKIMDEVKKNETLIKILNKERDYISALALSNRQDIMDTIIQHKVIVYENYADAVNDNSKLVLTNELSEYLDAESFCFLIEISSTNVNKLGDILSDTLGDLRIHLTLSSTNKVIKTTSIKITELLKKISFLIPLKTEMVDVTEMNVNIKILTNIPGALDAKQKIWTLLYRKTISLHSEHFIKFNLHPNKPFCLKKHQESLEELILQIAENQYRNLFEFTDVLKLKPASKDWQMYVRLPNNYQEVFKNKDLYMNHFKSNKASYFLQQFTSEDFLKSKGNLIFDIGKQKVKIEIYNDSFTEPQLKISSTNMKIALNIRNFLSDLFFYVFINFEPGKEFRNLSFYAAVEILQKSVKKCVAGSSQEEIEPLLEQFEKNVIGVLPI